MASSSLNCWKCLSRPSVSATFPSASSLIRPATASFSTTSRNLAGPPPPKKDLKAKGMKFTLKKKEPPRQTGKPPAQGERKAMRKRIVLSNTNALEVANLRDLDAEMVDDMVRVRDEAEEFALQGAMAGREGKEVEVRQEVVGRVVGLKGETVDSLRAVEAFKTTQGWGLFRRPALLVREESVGLSRQLLRAQEEKRALRLVIDGEKGTGKSLMLIHAIATAFVKGWVVVNIPEAQDVVNASTDYSLLSNTTPQLWAQNKYIATLLDQTVKANRVVLDALVIQKEHALPVPIQSNISLARLCELGARDPDVSWPFFQAFWSEMSADGRPPLLLCLDGLSHVLQKSAYRAPDVNDKPVYIHAHDLAIIRHFTEVLSGALPLPNGGAVIAASSRSHAPVSKSLNLAVQQGQERQTGLEITKRDPYEKKYDARSDTVLKSIEVLKLKGLRKYEARGLMEYWAQSGVLRRKVNEEEVAEKWALAGNGIVGEIERGALRMRI